MNAKHVTLTNRSTWYYYDLFICFSNPVLSQHLHKSFIVLNSAVHQHSSNSTYRETITRNYVTAWLRKRYRARKQPQRPALNPGTLGTWFREFAGSPSSNLSAFSPNKLTEKSQNRDDTHQAKKSVYCRARGWGPSCGYADRRRLWRTVYMMKMRAIWRRWELAYQKIKAVNHACVSSTYTWGHAAWSPSAQRLKLNFACATMHLDNGCGLRMSYIE